MAPRDYDWRWRADVSARFDMSEPQHAAREIVADALARMPMANRILDVGCGTGARTLALLAAHADRRWHCAWLDPSEVALAELDRAARAVPLDAEHLLVPKSLEQLLGGPATEYDVLLSFHGFYPPASDVDRLVAAMVARVARPGFVMIEISATGSALHRIQEEAHAFLYGEPLRRARSDDVKRALERATGGEVLARSSIERIRMPARFATADYGELEEMERTLLRWIAGGGELRADQGACILGAFKGTMIEQARASRRESDTESYVESYIETRVMTLVSELGGR